MSRPRRALFTLLVAAILVVTLVSCSANGNGIGNGLARLSISAADRQRFQELLNSVDTTALHKVLHVAEAKYPHGAYEEDKTAMEMVHVENADVATSLVELAKRQAGNTTAAATEPSTAVGDTTTTAGATSQTPTVAPTTPGTSQSPPPTTPASTPPTVAPTPTPSTEPTTPSASASAPAPPTPSASASSTQASVQPTTQESSQPTAQAPTTTPLAVPTSPGQSTNGGSPSTLVPGASTSESPTITSRSVTQQTIYTTTQANGAVQTVTSITVVAGQADETPGSPARTSTARGSLQTNGGSMKNAGLGGIIGALGMVVAGAL